MLPVKRINESSLLSLEMLRLSIFQAFILTSLVYFGRVSYLFFKPTSSICEAILVKSLVYFWRLHPRFASLFQSSLLSIFHAYILDSQVYFSRVSCLFYGPTSSLCESILVQSNQTRLRQAHRQADRQRDSHPWPSKQLPFVKRIIDIIQILSIKIRIYTIQIIRGKDLEFSLLEG